MEDDFDRTYFCERMMDMLGNIISQLEDLMFSDDCTFPLNGHANWRNYRYWATEILTGLEKNTANPQKVNVWAGIVGTPIIGPFFIESNLNGDHYLALLQNDVIPTLGNLDPDLEPSSSIEYDMVSAGWSTTTLPT